MPSISVTTPRRSARSLGIFLVVVAATCVNPDQSPSLEQLSAMGSNWDFPIVDGALPCLSLDTASVARGDTVQHQPFGNGERFRCVLSLDDTVIVALVLDETDAAFRFISALRTVDATGLTIDSLPGGTAEPPPPRTPFLVVQDLDFDGTGELKLLSWWGVTGNTGWTIFRRDPPTRRVVLDTVLTRVGDPEPLAAPGARCVRVVGTGGHVGMIRTISVYCWDGDRLPELFRSSQEWNDSTRRYVRRSYARADGRDSLVLIRTESFPAPGER